MAMDFEYGTKHNLRTEIPEVGWMRVSTMASAGPIEREEMRRADRIDLLVAKRQKNERRKFKGY